MAEVAMYHFTCICGLIVASPLKTGVCRCGRAFELTWPVPLDSWVKGNGVPQTCKRVEAAK